jgi:hypothetical protein
VRASKENNPSKTWKQERQARKRNQVEAKHRSTWETSGCAHPTRPAFVLPSVSPKILFVLLCFFLTFFLPFIVDQKSSKTPKVFSRGSFFGVPQQNVERNKEIPCI